MEDNNGEIKGEPVDTALSDMKLEEGGASSVGGTTVVSGTYDDRNTPGELLKSRSSTPATKHSASQSPIKMKSPSGSPSQSDDDKEDVIGGDITISVEPGNQPKISRKGAKKVAPRPPILYNDYDDVTEEALKVFKRIDKCVYGIKGLGYSEHGTMDCDCSEDWSDGKNNACGDDSDCINRLTKMECVMGNCNCGTTCQNQRFQRQDYADVSVIKTEKKGYGLRANTNLDADDFIFEYIGEVVNEPNFRRRMIAYDQENLKHLYFMSLTKTEFVDATKSGNLGRFCNHSCNPNCFVDKWVVGDKLRMGIFAQRNIQKGEELVFNYNVDRYGADPQPCYCGEPNCTGVLGGKTQSGRATKLSHATIEALGIDDGDGWDKAVAKKIRKKKSGEDDEEYVNNLQPKGLDEDGVRKVMASLMQCKEKWIAVKLLGRLQRCDDERVRSRVVQMHGYQILRTTLTTWKEDNNVILQVLDILWKFPRLTKNKISDSKIESAVATLVESEHEDIASEAKQLMDAWSELKVAYRIPRKKFDKEAAAAYERRPSERVEEVTKSPAKPFIAPTGPKNSTFQRAPFAPRAPPPRRNWGPLPSGWFEAKDEKGNPYFYSRSGQTTWQRPNIPAVEPPQPKAIPKSAQNAKTLQDIIQSITAEQNSQTPTQSVATAESTPKENKKPVEKWRSLSEEKQMKMYENTLLPCIKSVMAKFAKSLPKEDLKKFGKEVGKTLVASDFKHKRVEDPTRITDKQEKKIKKYVRDYFEKVVRKRNEHDEKKKEKLALNGFSNPEPNATASPAPNTHNSPPAEIDDDIFTPDTPPPPIQDSPSIPPATPFESPGTSRKRTHEELDTPENESHKRQKEGEVESVPTPPPPPPPPSGGMDVSPPPPTLDIDEPVAEAREETDEERELRVQEEELMRENDEAAAMEGTDDLDMVPGMKEERVDVDRELEMEVVRRNKDAFDGNDISIDGGILSNGDADAIFGTNMDHGDKMEGLEGVDGDTNGNANKANGNAQGHEREEVMSH